MNIPLANNAKAKVGFTEIAQVQGGFNRDYMVLSDRGAYRAKLAFSCVVQPEAGDKVLINVDAKHVHIIAIIERPDSQDATLSFPANVSMESKQGDIHLTSRNNINLTSSQQSHVTNKLSVTADESTMYTKTMRVAGKRLTAQWQTINTVSEMITTAAEKLISTVKNSFKTIEGVEQKTSKNYIQNVSSTTSIRSQNAIVTAEKDIKIDGERIHMG